VPVNARYAAGRRQAEMKRLRAALCQPGLGRIEVGAPCDPAAKLTHNPTGPYIVPQDDLFRSGPTARARCVIRQEEAFVRGRSSAEPTMGVGHTARSAEGLTAAARSATITRSPTSRASRPTSGAPPRGLAGDVASRSASDRQRSACPLQPPHPIETSSTRRNPKLHTKPTGIDRISAEPRSGRRPYCSSFVLIYVAVFVRSTTRRR
jgi:hypothetical protein